MKKKIDIRKKTMKTNFICGIILLATGIILELKTGIVTVLKNNTTSLNLNLVEVDTSYDKEEKNENNNQTDTSNTTPTQMSNTIDTSWGWPASLNYRITSIYSNNHPAIDIVSTDGNLEIYAASSGVIVTDSYKWDGGNYLILKQDNGYYTLYCHLASKSVTTGQRVEKGQVIGIMGTTGLSTGVHLHYSVWDGYPYYGSSHINPWNFY